MKSANWISATGISPFRAAPMATPTMHDSARGVSRTRASPNLPWRPSVARKTPPFLPTSSPNTQTRSSRSISSSIASRMPSIRVLTATFSPPPSHPTKSAPCHRDFVGTPGSRGRVPEGGERGEDASFAFLLLEHVPEQIRGGRRRGCLRRLHSLLHLGRTRLLDLLVLVLGEDRLLQQVGAKALDRVPSQERFQLLLGPV